MDQDYDVSKIFREKNGHKNLQNRKKALYDYWISNRIITDTSVLEAFTEVARELFIDPTQKDLSYADHPLPIGNGQTISQPTTVMIMLQLLSVKPGNKILEVGTGSGYNAALLAYLGDHVVTLERHHNLTDLAQNNLKKAGISNVLVLHADGKLGYEDQGPYDRIIITAAALQLSLHLKEQLARGGILVAPVGETHSCEMIKLHKTSPNNYKTSSHGLFSFVPLV